MFLCSPLPSWKQFFTNKKSSTKLYWENKPSLLFPESCISLHVLFLTFKELNKKERILIYIPDYFCDQTIESFREDWMEFYYYPIGEDLEPKWKLIEEHTKTTGCIPDFFLFVHYFGIEKNISQACDFCKRHNTLLIEDCAHVLLAKGKIASKGDFVIFSPHKQLPVPDAAILTCNENESNKGLWDSIIQNYNNLPRRSNNNKWYLKKLIQKLFKIHKKLPYYPGLHMGSGLIVCEPIERISEKSEMILRAFYDYTELKKICYIRRDNLSLLNYLISQIDNSIIPLSNENTFAPYYAVYSLKNTGDKKLAVQNLIEKGFSVLHWPDLPRDLLNKRSKHETAFELSEDIITIPIHQDLTPQKLCKIIGKEYFVKPQKTNFKIIWNKSSKDEWNSLLEQVDNSNISQEWIYGDAKKDVEGWGLNRGVIQAKDGKNIGIIQMLTKKVFGIPLAFRINRGPVLLHEYNTIDNHLQIIESIKRKKIGLRPLFYAPIIKWSPEAILKITSYKWKATDIFGFPSSTVNLLQSKDEIHDSLLKFWKKNLRKAQECVNIKVDDFGNVKDFIDLYKSFFEKKQIEGIPIPVLNYLMNLPKMPLKIITAYNNEGKLIAYKGLYLHGKTGTSFICWNTDEGRKKQARTLLIYESMMTLKDIGMNTFDAGGVDDINTEAVANFKRGINGIEYRLCGEFIRL
jgi:hypothetical protein